MFQPRAGASQRSSEIIFREAAIWNADLTINTQCPGGRVALMRGIEQPWSMITISPAVICSFKERSMSPTGWLKAPNGVGGVERVDREEWVGGGADVDTVINISWRGYTIEFVLSQHFAQAVSPVKTVVGQPTLTINVPPLVLDPPTPPPFHFTADHFFLSLAEVFTAN